MLRLERVAVRQKTLGDVGISLVGHTLVNLRFWLCSFGTWKRENQINLACSGLIKPFCWCWRNSLGDMHLAIYWLFLPGVFFSLRRVRAAES